MIEHDVLLACDTPEFGAVSVAAPVAGTGATPGRVRPERIEVVLASDRRREHAPELRERLLCEMMTGQASISDLSRREDICTSVLHRWHRQARIAAGQSVSRPMIPVRLGPSPFEAGRVALEVVLGNGRVLRVLAGADPALVAQMAAALER